MSLSYSEKDNQLTVTLNQAIDLISRNDGVGGGTRNPYAKLYLLPDRRDDSLRRTKTSYDTLQPVWNQVRLSFCLISGSHHHHHHLSPLLFDTAFLWILGMSLATIEIFDTHSCALKLFICSQKVNCIKARSINLESPRLLLLNKILDPRLVDWLRVFP